MAFFYLSFVGNNGFRGATVVVADDARAAISKSHRMKLNPGGEVMIVKVPTKLETSEPIIACLNRLVGEDELFKMGAVVHVGRKRKKRT